MLLAASDSVRRAVVECVLDQCAANQVFVARPNDTPKALSPTRGHRDVWADVAAFDQSQRKVCEVVVEGAGCVVSLLLANWSAGASVAVCARDIVR